MLQYKIPQNVGIEDKIVGPLSLRQLIILSIGIGISYVLFAIIGKFYELNVFEYVVISLPAILAAALALVKIHDATFGKFVILFLEYNLNPKQRVWDHRGIASLVTPDLTDGHMDKPKEITAKESSKKVVNLEDLGRILDSGGFNNVESIEHSDIDNAKDEVLVQQAFFGHKKNKTENMYWRTSDSHKERLKVMAKQTALRPATTTTPTTTTVVEKPTTSGTTAKTSITPNADTATKKKPRKRRQSSRPARNTGSLNTLHKNKPVTYKNKPSKKFSTPPKNVQKGNQSGEFKFEELQKGEIEINLD